MGFMHATNCTLPISFCNILVLSYLHVSKPVRSDLAHPEHAAGTTPGDWTVSNLHSFGPNGSPQMFPVLTSHHSR